MGCSGIDFILNIPKNPITCVNTEFVKKWHAVRVIGYGKSKVLKMILFKITIETVREIEHNKISPVFIFKVSPPLPLFFVAIVLLIANESHKIPILHRLLSFL